MQDRLTKGRQTLDAALEALHLLCEAIEPPGGELEAQRYFCGNTEIPTDLSEREPRRVAFYKATAGLVRAYAGIADEMSAAGYSDADQKRIESDLNRFLKLREIVRVAAGETLDVKPFEADMRHLIDTFVQAEAPRKISPFEGLSLLEIIAKTGIERAIEEMPEGLKRSRNAVAETIENNVRSKIIKDHLSDPAFYEQMSALLDELIDQRKNKALEYEEYLKKIAELAKSLESGGADDVPATIDTPARRALFHNLGGDAEKVLQIDAAVLRVRPDDWRGIDTREKIIKGGLYTVLGDVEEVERIFAIIFEHRGEY